MDSNILIFLKLFRCYCPDGFFRSGFQNGVCLESSTVINQWDLYNETL